MCENRKATLCITKTKIIMKKAWKRTTKNVFIWSNDKDQGVESNKNNLKHEQKVVISNEDENSMYTVHIREYCININIHIHA